MTLIVKTDDSGVTVNRGGTTFYGTDGVNLYKAIVLRSGLQLYARTGMKPNRAWTPTAMLDMAASYTGKKYRRGQHMDAANDLAVWIATMKAALPIDGSSKT
jgi:hypothetical protein